MMHLFPQALLALVLGLLVATALFLTGGYRGKSGKEAPLTFLVFFLTAFAFIWAGGAMAKPVGPILGDIYWVPFAFWAIAIGLILAAFSSFHARHRAEKEDQPEVAEREGERAEKLAGAAFWYIFAVMFLTLVLAAIFAAATPGWSG
jgi:hypothetical protein